MIITTVTHQLTRLARYRALSILALLTITQLAAPAQAEIVTLELSSGISARADFRSGDPALPPVLVMHGFMSTHSFNTIRGIVDALADNGYTVLAPTLSLGINQRQQGLNCEAVHTHTMQQDIQEISEWLEWLQAKTGKDIVVVGHSTGSLQLAVLAATLKPSNIQRVVLTAPSHFEGDAVAAAKEHAREFTPPAQGSGDAELGSYSLGYCKGNFVSTYPVYHSYQVWSGEKTLEALRAIEIPVAVIMGQNDDRFGSDWLQAIRQSGVAVSEIQGANHFFDSPYEFDFHDALLQALK